MSLERRGSRVYYTRSRRIGGRIVRKYVGSGRFAEVMAELDALERRGRQGQQEWERRDREQMKRVDEILDVFHAAIEALARGVLLTYGYHRHHRGTWRRRREKNEEGARETQAVRAAEGP